MFGLRRCVRIACEPIPWSGQGGQKNEEKQQPISEPSFFVKNIICEKTELQKVSKRVREFRGKRLLGHLWIPSLFFDSKSESTAAPKWSQGPKKSFKVLQKWTQGCKSDPKRVPKLSKCVKDRLRFWTKGRQQNK